MNAYDSDKIEMKASIIGFIQRKETDKLKSESLSIHDGPFSKAIEKSLQDIGVQRQAYHGGAFIGNHVHLCCQVSYT